MTNKKPFITTIVAVHNGAETLEHCLESVASQIYPHTELIVIDGGSTDGSVDIIKKYSDHISHWESSADKGIYDAWNKAIPLITGNWFCFLGSDDFFWDESSLELISEHLENVPESIQLVYGILNIVDRNGNTVAQKGRPWPYEYNDLRKGIMKIPHPGLMHRTNLVDVFGFFDIGFQYSGDYEYLLRVSNSNNAMFFPNITVAGMSDSGTTSLFDNRYLILKENLKALKINKVPGIPWALLKSCFKSIARSSLNLIVGRNTVEKVWTNYKCC